MFKQMLVTSGVTAIFYGFILIGSERFFKFLPFYNVAIFDYIFYGILGLVILLFFVTRGKTILNLLKRIFRVN